MINVNAIVGALIYSVMGILIFGIGFILFDKATPYALWKEIVEEKNVALAIVVGAVSLGISIIISSAIH